MGHAVLCANPNDRDFPPNDPDCRGLIELRTGADEGGGDYACPACGRVVYPMLRAKEQVALLTVTLNRTGIERFLQLRCGEAAVGQTFESGVLVLPDRPQNRLICVVDFCSDPDFCGPGWVERQPCIQIVVDPRAQVLLCAALRARRVELVDLVCGSVVMDELLGQTSVAGPRLTPAGRNFVPPPADGLLLRPDAGVIDGSSRKLVIGLASDGVMVGGVLVRCNTSAVPYLAFAELVQQAVSDSAAGPEIVPLTAQQIAERIEGRLPAATVNPGTVQTGLRRLEQSILDRLREAGLRVSKDQVIENVARAGKYSGRHGFRLNSDTVALDPKGLRRA
jgi:hypothetical protein